ncbi:transcription elongation factor GreA [bacterium]|nr:transcription elongation factor GreA [bacterium]MBU1881871.1 transcription elongation factor GreA [bacterium]
MSRFVYMSREGIEKLKTDLKRLIEVEQPKISEKLEIAREHGDLSENAEYDAAKEEMSMLQSRIIRLQDTLSRAQIFDPKGLEPDEISMLSTVELKDLKRKKNVTYTLVSAEETDIDNNRISVQSPVGKALIGKRVGDEVTVEVPAGILQFKILSNKRD